MIQWKEDMTARILVIGVGGAGRNFVNRMIEEGVTGVEFVCTDSHVNGYKTKQFIKIGRNLTKGLPACEPEVGRAAAEENREEIASLVKGADIVFVVCGMGAGTGTGASPVVAEISRELGILTVGIVTKPFSFEPKSRMNNAISGIETLRENVDTLIVISNDKLLQTVDRNISLPNLLGKSDEVLQRSVQGITDLITMPLLADLDFMDVKMAMKDKGIAHIGIGTGTGKNMCMDAVKEAVSSPLLETAIQGAFSVIINISGDVGLAESSEVASYIEHLTGEDTCIIWGSIHDDSEVGTVRITVIATGLEERGEDGGLT